MARRCEVRKVRIAEAGLVIGRAVLARGHWRADYTERVTISSEGGRWKSIRKGNSLAAYPTSRTGLTGGLGRRATR